MSEPELIQRQREILRAFRQATAWRAKAEADANARSQAARDAAYAALNQADRTAYWQREKAREVLKEAQTTLTQAGLQSFLEQIRSTPPTTGSGDDPAKELSWSVSLAVESSKGLINHLLRILKIGGE